MPKPAPRLLRRLAAGAVGLGLVVALVSLAIPVVAVLSYHEPTLPPDARAIIVLSGDDVLGGLGPETAARVDRGVALWKAGAAPILMFTGALWDPAGVNQSSQMVSRAVLAGVDPQAIRLDPDSRSTLQNALFTGRVLGRELGGNFAAPVILVTNRWHLPRAWASFRWAGFTNMTLVASDGAKVQVTWSDLGYEVLKWPFNVLRGSAASLMMAVGAPQQDVDAILP